MLSYSEKVNRSYQIPAELDKVFQETCKLEGFTKSDVIRMLIEAYMWVVRIQPELRDAPLKYRVLEALKSARPEWMRQRADYKENQGNNGWFNKRLWK